LIHPGGGNTKTFQEKEKEEGHQQEKNRKGGNGGFETCAFITRLRTRGENPGVELTRQRGSIESQLGKGSQKKKQESN